MLRFAIEAAMASFSHNNKKSKVSRLTGRQLVAEAARCSAGEVSGSLQKPNRLPDLAMWMEDCGIAQPGQLTRLAMRAGANRPSPIPGNWWPRVSQANSLGRSNPNFRCAEDVLLAGYALRERLSAEVSHSVDFPPPNLPCVEEVIEALVFQATGPYGSADEALDILTAISSHFHVELSARAAATPMGKKVVRCLDRAARSNPANSALAESLESLLSTPPQFITNRTDWLRATRRCLWLHSRSGVSTPPTWAMSQLVHASIAHGPWEWATPIERRYAIWALAEFAVAAPKQSWVEGALHHEADVGISEAFRAFINDPSMSALNAEIATARQTRTDRTDFVDYCPDKGWPRSAVLDEHLNALASAVGQKKLPKAQHELWGWASEDLRSSILVVMQEMLTTPCVIRNRMCVDTLFACGALTRDAVSANIAELLQNPGLNIECEQERAITVLGYLKSSHATEALESVFREADRFDESILRAAARSSAQLWRYNPEEAGLHGFALTAMENLDNPSSRAIAMYLKAMRHDASWSLIDKGSPLERNMARWCAWHVRTSPAGPIQEQLAFS